MDDDICKWVIDFMLRSSIDNHFLNPILVGISLPDKDFRLKKAVLLRAIETEISEAYVTERLFIIEMIEQLDRTEGLAIMGSMKSAYCAVAVECTAKYLAVGGVGNRGRFSDAVRRIWRGRVTEMERSGKSELVSRELKGWEDELESALCDKGVWKRLEGMNTRNEALKLIGDYLVEAWGVLGPSFLQLSAYFTEKKTMNDMHSAQLAQAIDKSPIVSEDVGGGIEMPSRTEDDSKLERQGSVPPNSRDDTKRNDLLNMNRDNVDQDSCVNVGSTKHTTFVGMNPNPERVRELDTKTTEGKESVEEEVVGLRDPSPSRHENLKTPVLQRCKSLVLNRHVRGGAITSRLKELENDGSSDKYTCLHNPEVEQAQEAIKTSGLEFKALVEDPLPDALSIGESVASDPAKKSKTCEHSPEDQNDAGPAYPVIIKDAVPLRAVYIDLKNPCHGHPTIVPRPSIMEHNITACTHEWNDSIDDSPEGNHDRLHLPSPKRKAISPSKYEETKLARRRRKMWSALEEDTLRTAVQRFGKGNWKLILNSYRDIFDLRTEVDLKDKWRNITKC